MEKSDEKNGGIIRRPVFIFAVFFAAGIVLGRYFNLKTEFIVASVIFAILSTSITHNLRIRKKTISLLMLGISCFFFSALLSATAYNVDYINTGENMNLQGRVYSQPYKNDYGSTVLLLDDVNVDGQQCGNVKLYISEANAIKCGDVLSARVDIEIPKGVRNPGGFDEKLYLLSQGISYKAYAQNATVTGEKDGLDVLLSDTRRYIGDSLDKIFEVDVAPLAKAMLLGDTQGIDEQTYTAFKDTGMAHVLAVSGLNAAILVAFLYGVLKILKAGRQLRLIITLVFIIAYTCITGLTPSIVRAAIMAGAVLIGTYFGRQNDTLNYLSFAFIISLIIRPLDLFTAGFQLSFAAVFGMVTLGWQIKYWWNKILSKKLKRTGDALSASIGATAGTIPVLASSFNRISTLSVIINLAVIPLASAATILVFISALFGLIFGEAAAFIAFPATMVIRTMLLIIHSAASIPFAAVNIASPQFILIAASILLIYISSKYLLLKVRIKAILCAAIVTAVILIPILTRFDGMYVVFLDTGQGDAGFFKTEQGGEYFVDGGNTLGAEEVLSFALRNGYAPDAAFLSHSDEDHISGIVKLYEAGLIHKVYCSWQEKDYVKSVMPEADVIPLSAGDRVLLDDNTSALVLYPYKDTISKDKNGASLVFLLQYRNYSALFTGDIPGTVETEIFAGLNEISIYKASHHGSKESSFRLPLSVLRPECSVIYAGRNNYGLPNPSAVTNLSEYSGKVYITMNDMAVEFFIKDGIKVNTYGSRNE